MKYFELVKEKLSSLWPMWLVIMFVAFWSVYIQDGQINRDGLLYLKQAYLIAEGDWKEGLARYPWPFFSILIAVFYKLTNLHLQVVAHGVDIALFGIAAWFYLKTLQLIHNKERNIIFYGGIILLSFTPIMDDYVGMVLRDHGLWAGCMMGTYFYFKNHKEYSLKNSITWQFGFLFAGLFRPEGLVILVLLPLWNLTNNSFQKLNRLVLDYSLSIFLVILSLFAIFLLNVDLMNAISSSRLTEFLNRPVQFLNQLVKPLPIKTDNEYLSDLFENYSLIITYAVLLSVLFFKWIKGLGLLHGGLFFYSFFLKKIALNNFQKHIYFFLTVSFILVTVNLFNVYVLTNRYWGFHWWWALILISNFIKIIFDNEKVIQKFNLQKILYIICFLLILNTLVDSDSKTINYKEASNFLISQKISNSAKYINSDRLAYYSGVSLNDLIRSEQLGYENFEYIVVLKNVDEKLDFTNYNYYSLYSKFVLGNNNLYILKKTFKD